MFGQMKPSCNSRKGAQVDRVTSVTSDTNEVIRRCVQLTIHLTISLRLVRIFIADHPLINHKMTALRDERTDSPTFRRLADELVTLLAYEATRDIAVTPVTIQTPVSAAQGVHLSYPTPVIIPILRAGLGMLEGMTRLLPTAEVGFLGMMRNEETLQPSTYADRIPGELAGRHVFLLDPMLATGGSLAAAIDLMRERGATKITAVCLLAAPEGVKFLTERFDGTDLDLRVFAASLDERLNEHGYIVPGLGDAGDRLFGVV